jgi:transcription elongation GreA/GreB family factor
MSRAFVKEPDGDEPDEGRPRRPPSPHPNYITPGGLAVLKRRLQETEERRRAAQADSGRPEVRLRLAELDDEIRHLRDRIAEAVVVDPRAKATTEICFGATVVVADQDGKRRTIVIAGEDEADAKSSRVSWVSPLARALLGARVGDVVTWARPTGDRDLKVVSISYA